MKAIIYASTILIVGLVSAAFAEEAPSDQGIQSQEPIKSVAAAALIQLGKENKDPLYLVTAAKILAGMKVSVLDADASLAAGKPVFYDPHKIAEEARNLAGDNQFLLDQIKTIGQPGERYWVGNCYWNGWRWVCLMK